MQADLLRGREEGARVDEYLREQLGVQLVPELVAHADVHDAVGARVEHDDAVVARARAACEPLLPVAHQQVVGELRGEIEQLRLRVALPMRIQCKLTYEVHAALRHR